MLMERDIDDVFKEIDFRIAKIEKNVKVKEEK
jgi:hypothetical protein